MSTLDLVLIGFGNVAREFVRLWRERADAIAAEAGVEARVVGIASRRHGCVWSADAVDAMAARGLVDEGRSLDELAGPYLQHLPDAFAVLERLKGGDREAPSVMIETTPLEVERGQPALDHLLTALDAGAHVVTANKGPIAHGYRALADRARSRGLQLRFESTVMDGIPVFALVRETLPVVRVLGFRGVVNSTTNHILTEMERGHSFEAALADMQARGIAEADPSLDVDGWDAAAKTAVLINVLMHGSVTPQDIDRTGIRGVTRAAVTRAVERGRRVRLVASAGLAEGRIRGTVTPAELPERDVLACLEGQANALVLETDLLGRLVISQLDGGLTMTAYGLLTDTLSVAKAIAS